MSRDACLLIALSLLVSVGCGNQRQDKIEEIEKPPKVSSRDRKFAGVFRDLDGLWRGKFYVYADTRGQISGPSQPTEIDEETLQRLPLRLETAIDVEQRYRSETPYFQRVTIRDTYRSPDGRSRTVESHGVNKVQNGRLWCVIVKPDETVVHRGTVPAPHTIVWRRKVREPLKVEYFKETVLQDTYTIVGWGYYGKDRVSLSPRTWFLGKYRRVK